MKKSYLLIAAAAAIFAACADMDNFKEISKTEQGAEIAFSTYTQKATRAENSTSAYGAFDLKDHHETFRVWGYKNTEADAVFNGDSVGYNTSSTNSATKWGYLFNRYWDKTATTYEFYAFAPYDAPFSFDGVSSIATQKDGYFKITSAFDKVGDNVSPKNAASPVASWKGLTTDNVDLMIADTCRLTDDALKNAQNGKVQLNFIHILSRLNITIKTIDGFDPTVATDDSLCVDSIIISNFAHAGTFSEIQGNVDANQLKAGATERWTSSNVKKYRYDLDYTATTSPIYAVEALMIPQTIVKDTINLDGTYPTGANVNAPYIKIAYSIYSYNPQDGSKETNKEHFTAYYNLAKVFGIKTNDSTLEFNEGWQNTLNISISPATIKFDASAAPWATFKNEDLEIK